MDLPGRARSTRPQPRSAKGARFNRVLREHGVFKSPGKTYPSLALTEADFAWTEAAVAMAAAAVA